MITNYETIRDEYTTRVIVTSDLAGTIYYHWYLDGVLVASTESNEFWFYLEQGEQARIEVLDTNDPDFDAVQNAPDGWPARRLIWWVRSIDATIDHYRVEQQQDAGDWSTVAEVPHDDNLWHYQLLSERLDDLADYAWRVVPVDAAGNDGASTLIGPERIVRAPDAPDYEISFNAGPTTVTFAEAS